MKNPPRWFRKLALRLTAFTLTMLNRLLDAADYPVLEY